MSLFEVLRNIKQYGFDFSCIESYDRFEKAKMQEDFFIQHSNGFLMRLNNNFNDGYLFDSELDLKFGDLVDKSGNYLDLKVGKDFTGAISTRSIEAFGDTKTDRHLYICTNTDLSKIYCINARLLKDIKVNKPYLGELDYKHFSFARLI